MGWDLLKSFLVFLLIVVGFIFILLLPREMEITHHGGLVFTADFPFTFDLFKEKVQDFIHHFQTEKGFGENKMGVPILEELQTFLQRDLHIIIPAFFLAIFFGMILGIIQFYFREKWVGRIQAFLSWIFSSIPDFFFYIGLQYILIKLVANGYLQMNLFGNDDWYSFILPMIAVTIFPMLFMMKFTSTSLENEVGQDYLRTARSKGLQRLFILKHMLWNCWPSILNQAQFVMLYILSSLPIIEKLSSYQGAGYHLLDSIFKNEDVRSLAFMLPYLVFMFATVVLSKLVKHWLVPIKSGALR
ncbi:ABC transporter permease subunit [Robertmurraya yapensis]|uniref:ABC transporter permease subunit n=1 Tax=Bacillus yapensis TaxID=2492960 RepID=A0A431W8M8_9BACI|nr:ABC transporter permease subunit [Bacillus yapensis]RTR31819.1 ABC transporter permease subunit [Bacillus yapensis]TKS95832.1 ABC transporter permease subunit [Bacillus yapensis]